MVRQSTVENKYNVRIIECGVSLPHDPHTWREGFLWHRKCECEGVPATFGTFDSFMPEYAKADVRYTASLYTNIFHPEEEPHRHYYGFSKEKSDIVHMVWVCLDPFCQEEYYRFRSVFNFQARGRSKMQTVFYKKQKI